MTTKIINKNCLEAMRELPENSIDSILTDPPYGLEFMGKEWDHGIPGPHFWIEALRVAKPGAHMLAFGGTRTHHRLFCAIEDAGWEIRDTLMWVYGQGFPKSHNISKAIDKINGKEREKIWIPCTPNQRQCSVGHGEYRPYIEKGQKEGGRWVDGFTPISDLSKQWNGWGTGLKPAWEPIVLARKPVEGTIANNVLKWGTGGLNIDGCRVETNDKTKTTGHILKNDNTTYYKSGIGKSGYFVNGTDLSQGRFPANFIHDGSDEVVDLFPKNKSTIDITKHSGKNGTSTFAGDKQVERIQRGDSGSTARFFYCAKPGKSERNNGCESLPENRPDERTDVAKGIWTEKGVAKQHNDHPTVKPVKLLRYLAKLITPPNGTILDPFAGSGSTGVAAKEEGFDAILIEIDGHYCDIIKNRTGGIL